MATNYLVTVSCTKKIAKKLRQKFSIVLPLCQLQRGDILVIQFVHICAAVNEDLANLLAATAHSIVKWGRVPEQYGINYG